MLGGPREVRGGALFVFFGRRRDAVKILFADDSGLCLFYKRLDRSTFRVPEPAREGDLVVAIEERELDDLLDGIAPEPASPRLSRSGHAALCNAAAAIAARRLLLAPAVVART